MWRHMTAPLPSIVIVRRKKDAAFSRANAFHGLLAGTLTGCSDKLHVIGEEMYETPCVPSGT